MNPNAASFSFSAGASRDARGARRRPPPPTEAKPVPEEKDKLWKCVLKLANNDRTEAKRLLQNPHELIANEAVWDHMDLVDLEKLEKSQQAAPAPPPPVEEEKVVEEVVEVQEEDPSRTSERGLHRPRRRGQVDAVGQHLVSYRICG